MRRRESPPASDRRAGAARRRRRVKDHVMADLNPKADERSDAHHQRPAFAALMSSIGYLMFEWSLLEHALLDEIKRLRVAEGRTETTPSKPRGAFSERLAEWQALVSQRCRRNLRVGNALGELSSQAERLNRRRKAVAHHFVGASGHEDGGEPAIYVSEGGVGALRSAQARVTLDELHGLIDEARICRHGIAELLSTI